MPREGVVAWGAITLCVATCWVILGTHTPHATVWGVCALGLPYLLLLWGLSAAPSLSWVTIVVCVVAALWMRVCGVWAPPLLSDDVFRYVWDGRVWAAGINPYIHAPADPMLGHLRDASIWPQINHPEIPTIYPPLAQLVFLTNAMVGWGVTGLKAIFVGFEWGCMALAAASLRRLGWSRARITAALLVVALNPLMVIETAWSGHLDVLAFWPLTLGFLWVWRLHHARSVRAKSWAMVAAGGLLGWSIGAKLLGVILLPLCATRERFLWGVGIVIVALGLTFASVLPLREAGGEMTTGFRAYAASWRHNDGPFRLLVHANHLAIFATAKDADRQKNPDGTQDVLIRLHALDDFFVEKGWTKTWQGQTLPDTTFTHDQVAQSVSKLLVAGLMALLLCWTLLITRQPLLAAPLLLGTFFFLSPTVFPWYIAWLIPWTGILWVPGDHKGAPLIAATLLTPLAYLGWASAMEGGDWAVPTWALWAEFGGVCAVCVATWLTRARGG